MLGRKLRALIETNISLKTMFFKQATTKLKMNELGICHNFENTWYFRVSTEQRCITLAAGGKKVCDYSGSEI